MYVKLLLQLGVTTLSPITDGNSSRILFSFALTVVSSSIVTSQSRFEPVVVTRDVGSVQEW